MKLIKNKTVVINTRITFQTYKEIKLLAAEKNMRPSEFVRQLILKQIK